MPASENLHASRLMHRSKRYSYSTTCRRADEAWLGFLGRGLGGLRLITSSNRVGCSTGMSAGLAPRNTLTSSRAR